MMSWIRDALRRQETRLWGLLGAAFVLAAIATVVLVAFVINPAPPRHVVMATGPAGGLYETIGARLAERLARDHVTLELVSTKGSVDNLQRLQAEGPAAVDIALVQGGIDAPGASVGVASLGAVAAEPLWLFHRRDVPLADMRDVAGLRVAAGPDGSGARALLSLLLAENGVAVDSVDLVPLGGAEAAAALQAGAVDAAVFVTGPDRPYIRALALDRAVSLLSFARAEAYARRQGFLSPALLPRGVLDLATDTPAQDVHLVSAAASLLVRENLHPAIQALVLQAAQEAFSSAGLLTPAGTFPTPDLTKTALTAQAERYYARGGPTVLRRYLPFWAANMLERLWVLAIPAATLLYPLGKAAPPVYRWRVRSRIVRWYRDLRRLEQAGRAARDDAELTRIRAELKRILVEVAQVEVPLPYNDDVFRLRSHIRFVDQLLADEQRGSDGGAARSAGAAEGSEGTRPASAILDGGDG